MSETPSYGPQPSPIPPKWLKWFLIFNISVLAGFFIYELAGPSRSTSRDMNVDKAKKAAAIKKAIAKNPPPGDFSGKLSADIEYVINATEGSKWVHFSFATATVYSRPDLDSKSKDWDIAFRRAKIVTNGGATGSGEAAVSVAREPDYDSVVSAPLDGYAEDAKTDNPAETRNPVIDKWYAYDFWTHQLKPNPVVYIVRTADGHYARMQITGYYCGSASGCYTIKYRYQGRDTQSFVE